MRVIVFLILALLLFSNQVWAQESPSPSPSPSPQAQDRVKEGIQNIRQNLREGVKVRKQEIKETASPSPLPRVEKANEKREGAIESKKAQLKERLQSVKNEQKRKIVERISQQTDQLNARMMNHFSAVLDRLEKVLANIKSRIDKAEANKWDVSGVRAMIKSAEEAIASAKTAVEAQKAKTYTPEITGDEEKLKVEVGKARKILHSDLVAVKEKVKAAHEFVKAVAKALAQSPRIDELETPKAGE